MGPFRADVAPESVAIRRLLFPLLCLVALLTSQISPAYILACVLAILWFYDMLRRGTPAASLTSPLFGLALLLAGFTALATLFSRDPAVSVRHLAGVGLFLLIAVTIDLVDSPRKGRWLFLALGGNGCLLALLGVWQFAHGGDDLENRIRGTLSHYMTFSGLTMLAGCVLLGFLFEERGWRRGIGLAAVLPFGAMMLTFTRGAYVGTLAAILAYLVVRRPRRVLLLAPALILVFVLVPVAIRARIVSIASPQERTNRERVAMLHAGVRMIQDAPLFGLGPEMVKRYYPLYRDPGAVEWRQGHLHDNVVQIAAEDGLFAAAAYLALMFLFFARTAVALWRAKNPDRAALLSGAWMAGVALFVAGFFEYNFGDTEVEIATLIVLAVPFSRAFQSAPSEAIRGLLPADAPR